MLERPKPRQLVSGARRRLRAPGPTGGTIRGSSGRVPRGRFVTQRSTQKVLAAGHRA